MIPLEGGTLNSKHMRNTESVQNQSPKAEFCSQAESPMCTPWHKIESQHNFPMPKCSMCMWQRWNERSWSILKTLYRAFQSYWIKTKAIKNKCE